MAEPAKHYTVKRLAERWSCNESTVYKLIEKKTTWVYSYR